MTEIHPTDQTMTNSIDSRVDGAIQRIAERRGDNVSRHPATPGTPDGPERSADLLALTDKAQSLKALEREVARAPGFDAERVAELKQSIASGDYQVDAKSVAGKLLDVESRLP